MSESLPLQCLKITNDLINNDQLAQPFVKPYNPEKKLQADYNLKVKKPMDLCTVRKKIKDNNYSCFQEWVDDMNLIFDNAISFNGENSLFGGVAVYLQKQFGKKIREIETMNLRNYEDQLISLGNKLEQVLKKPPPTLNVTCSYEMNSKDSEDFTVSRLKSLREKIIKMVESHEEEAILNCINESNSEYNYTMGQEIEIDISHLGRHTLLCLEKLVNSFYEINHLI